MTEEEELIHAALKAAHKLAAEGREEDNIAKLQEAEATAANVVAMLKLIERRSRLEREMRATPSLLRASRYLFNAQKYGHFG